MELYSTENSNRILTSKITILDFKEKKLLNEVLLDNDLNKNDNIGIDHCFILTEKDINLESSDLLLKITTSYPAVQIYTLGFPSNQLIKPNQKMNKFQGIAIECPCKNMQIFTNRRRGFDLVETP